MQDDVTEVRCSDPADKGTSAALTGTGSSAGPVFQFLADGSRVFRVCVDVHDFMPNELSVRTEAGQLVVSGKQAVSSGHGQHSRQMTKTFDLPPDIDVDRLPSFCNISFS